MCYESALTQIIDHNTFHWQTEFCYDCQLAMKYYLTRFGKAILSIFEKSVICIVILDTISLF